MNDRNEVLINENACNRCTQTGRWATCDAAPGKDCWQCVQDNSECRKTSKPLTQRLTRAIRSHPIRNSGSQSIRSFRNAGPPSNQNLQDAWRQGSMDMAQYMFAMTGQYLQSQYLQLQQPFYPPVMPAFPGFSGNVMPQQAETTRFQEGYSNRSPVFMSPDSNSSSSSKFNQPSAPYRREFVPQYYPRQYEEEMVQDERYDDFPDKTSPVRSDREVETTASEARSGSGDDLASVDGHEYVRQRAHSFAKIERQHEEDMAMLEEFGRSAECSTREDRKKEVDDNWNPFKDM
ncbi:hypothetical protein KCU92_g1060, partial [Aureobasidium melanogenum]